MKPTITIEIPAESEPLVRQLLTLHQELQTLALAAPDGSVLDACETAVLAQGRDLHTRLLADAVARRIEAAEKKGPPCGPALAAGSRKTAVGPVATS